MLHREPDEDGNIDFRQIGGLDEHGLYHNEIGEEICKEILKNVKEYESGFLRQQLRFFEYVEKYFKENNLRNSQQMYDRMMRQYQKGKAIEIYVFYHGAFEKEVISE
jgi:F0F1-type ATP synthase gamma subunit